MAKKTQNKIFSRLSPKHKILDVAKRVLKTEAAAISALTDKLNSDFEKAVEMLYECKGRVVVTGMGKSGLVGKKIAATLASTGTPAFFLHPAEAAFRHAVEVDTTGRTIVLTCELEQAEFGRDQIHGYGADPRMPKSKGSMSAVVEPAGRAS